MISVAAAPKLLKAVKIIGIIQIAIGILLVAFGVVVLTILNQSYFINNNAAPIWAGICLICTGISAICAFVYYDEDWLDNTFWGFNILSIVLLFIDACFSLAAIVYYEACPAQQSRNYYQYDSYFTPTYPPCVHAMAGRGVFSVLLVLSVAGTTVSVVGLIKSCKLPNCRRNKKDTTYHLLVKENEMAETENDLEEGAKVVTLPNGKEYILIPYSVIEDVKTSQMQKNPPKYMHKDV